MDIVTHGLASFAVARGFFPRAGKPVAAAAVVAGCLADLDWLSTYWGAPAFLLWHRTYFHSVLAAIALSVAVFAILFAARSLRAIKTAQTAETAAAVHFSVSALIFGTACTALLHIVLDACQSDGVMLWWPFRAKRFAADWLPAIDPWILAILILTIAVPELLALVSSEIGAKSKKPRGQTGALIGLAVVFVYIAARGTLHSNAVGLLESRAFHGEAARRAVAYPEPLSLSTWHGIAETESALNQIDVHPVASNAFDADASLQIFKPQSSPALDVARNTAAAKSFLSIAQIPKASIEKTEAGYLVAIRDLQYAASGATTHEVAALIEVDFSNKVTSERLVWARDLRP